MTALPQRPLANDPPPPSLPPRPPGRGTVRPPPEEVFDEVYDDCEEQEFADPPGEIYDDCGENSGQPELLYDDCGENEATPPLPNRPHGAVAVSPPPADPPQEFYDDVGPIVQHLHGAPKKPGRDLPPTPSPLLPPLPPQITSSSQGNTDSVYEFDSNEMPVPPPSSSTPPPPPPPKNQKAASTPTPKVKPTPSPKSSGPPAGFGLFDANQIKDLKNNLRKVSVEKAPDIAAHDPKEYGECANMSDIKKKLEGKSNSGKPEPASSKPAFLPKFGKSGGKSPGVTSNHSSVKPDSSTESCSDPSPAVTFLPKNSSKHVNMPLPPVPTTQPPPSKPVAKFEPQYEPQEPEDIYDDAASADLMDKYDWFHGSIKRVEGEKRLKSVGKDGTYLVRVSEKDKVFPYTLMVLNKGQVCNLRIRQRPDNKFALGDQKDGEVAFMDVPGMIAHHKDHNVVLLGSSQQAHVKLQHHAKK